MTSINDGTDIERDAELRCKSTDLEKPGHTHACRLVATHTGTHRCICNRGWGEKASA